MSGTSNNNASYSTGGVRISRLVKWNQRWGIVIPRLLWYWACYMFAYQINARFKLLLVELAHRSLFPSLFSILTTPRSVSLSRFSWISSMVNLILPDRLAYCYSPTLLQNV
mmetsp:Transcript_17817/g.35739  ORF Transcript_17817/g.35739 Transcript_17817/m.35739 type:complete len:111 (+) Transcript_17817:2607-2939(+)